MAEGKSNKKVANKLVAVSCAAVLAVYAAGYSRTRSAAERFDVQAAERRTAAPSAPETTPAVAELRPAVSGMPSDERTVDSSSIPEAVEKPRLIASGGPASTTISAPEATIPSSPAETASASPVVSVAAPVIPIPETAAPAPELPWPVALPKAEIAAPAPPSPKWKDGTYYGWGSSRHGDIQAAVVIESGRIASATISQCRTRYPCSVIEMLPPEVAQRQSPDVDYVSRATQSANAFYYAVVEALGKAK